MSSPEAAPRALGTRELNRALLARQLLLQRESMPVTGTIEHLVGLQAQEPPDPYVGLWSRLEDFDPDELVRLISDRQAVRGTLMRTTIHLVTVPDYLRLRPLAQHIAERLVYGDRTRGRAHFGDLDMAEVLAFATVLMEEAPRTNSELRDLLGARWPDYDPEALARAVRYVLPVVQIPPRGLWGQSGMPRLTTIEHWSGQQVDDQADMVDAILRYLAAFGPATTADIRTWSGFTGIREVVDQLRPQLRTFQDEQGKELFDVPDGPLPDPDIPAPPRFLPQYDNVFLSHADRSRIVHDVHREQAAAFPGRQSSLLIDGFIRGLWNLKRNRRSATLTINLLDVITDDERQAVLDEAERLFQFMASDAEEQEIKVVDRV